MDDQRTIHEFGDDPRSEATTGASAVSTGRRRRSPWRWGCGIVALLLVLALVAVGAWVASLDRTLKDNLTVESLLPEEDAKDFTPDVELDVDTDGDGEPDLNVDTDGDGKPDLNVDVDGDGEPDFRIDADGDGKVDDEAAETGDKNLDGTVDDKDAGATAPDGSKADDPSQAAEGTRNILLIGEDKDSGSVRSDVMILAHVNAAGDRVTLVHFPRDLYVPIPGYGNNKLNAAYSFGGTPLLVRTFQGMLDVPIDDVAITDFESFRGITDAMGGVTVNNPQGSEKFPKGQVTLETGKEALGFVRERKTLSQGDISRGERQMAYLQAMLAKSLSRDVVTNPSRLAGTIDAATTGMRVTEGLDAGHLRSMGIDFVSGDRAVEQRSAPWTGPGTSPTGASIVVADWPELRQLADDIRSDSL